MSATLHRICLGILAVVIIPSMGYAQFETGQKDPKDTSRPEFDPIVVTVRGQAIPLSDTPGSVAVIESSQLDEQAPISLSNAFTSVPGVNKSSDSLWGSDINIRGLGRDSVVFSIDGCRVNTATDINAQYGLIDPSEIERIEVLKGPISSLYGSGTLGGVVNVITKNGKFSKTTHWENSVISSGMTNSLGFSTFGSTSYNSPDWYGYASQSVRDYASFKDGDGNTMHNSQFLDYSSMVKFGHKFSDEHKTEAQFQLYTGRDVGIPGTGEAPLPAAARVTYPTVQRGLYNLIHTWQPDGDILKESSLNLYYQFINRKVRLDRFPDAMPMVEVDPEAEHQTFGQKWQNQITAGDHSINTGLDTWQRWLHSSRSKLLKSGMELFDTPLPRSKFFSNGVFLEDSWKALEALTFNGGARYDLIHVSNNATDQYESGSENDQSWNAHIGATWNITEHWNTKLVAARGYRAASLEERFAYLELGGGKVKYGDPNLDPENSFFTEWSLGWANDSFSAQAAAFHNRLHNLIADKFLNENTIINANVQEARIYGTEFEVKWFIAEQWSLFGDLGWMRGVDTGNDEYLPNIPPLTGNGGVRYGQDEGFWGSLELPFSARQKQVPEGVATDKEWITTNLRFGYNLICDHNQHKMYLGIDNLFDSTYREYLTTSRGFDFNEPGRTFLVGYQVKF